MLNEDQQGFVDYVLAIIDQRPFSYTTLNGPAGTGKTFAINSLVRSIGTSKKVQCIAYTNSAAKNMGGMTINKYFGMRPLDPDSPLIEFDDALVVDAKNRSDVLILDECSMVTNKMIQNIKDYCLFNKVHLICVGDKWQLPPVDKTGESSGANMCFDHTEFVQLELIKIVRQKAGSSIITFSNQFKQHKNFIDVRYQANSTELINDIFAKKGLSYIDDDTIVIGYDNKSVMAINKQVSQMKFKDSELFHTGETIVLRAPVMYKSGEYYDKVLKETMPVFSMLAVGEELELCDCQATTREVTDVKGVKHTLDGYNVVVYVDNFETEKFLLHYDSAVMYKKLREEYSNAMYKASSSTQRETIKLRWGFSKLKGVMSAYHSYASTIHLSQGKTHKKTMLLTNTLYIVQVNKDPELWNRLMYVASTRPSDQLILTGKII